MSEGWKVRARRGAFSDAEEVAIFRGDEIVRFTFEAFDRHAIVGPTVITDSEAIADGQVSFLRAAMNAAWELGLRPDGFNDTRESMAATKEHLADMRAIAFHKIGAKSP